MIAIRIGFLLVCGLLAVTGCTTSRVYQTSGSPPSELSVAVVRVTVAPGLPAGAMTDYNAFAIGGVLREALTTELAKKGRLQKDGAELVFNITGLRIRTGSQITSIGVLAGGDNLSGVAKIFVNDEPVQTFEATAGGNDSFWSSLFTGRVSGSRRAEFFAQQIARRIVEKI